MNNLQAFQDSVNEKVKNLQGELRVSEAKNSAQADMLSDAMNRQVSDRANIKLLTEDRNAAQDKANNLISQFITMGTMFAWVLDDVAKTDEENIRRIIEKVMAVLEEKNPETAKKIAPLVPNMIANLQTLIKDVQDVKKDSLAATSGKSPSATASKMPSKEAGGKPN